MICLAVLCVMLLAAGTARAQNNPVPLIDLPLSPGAATPGGTSSVTLTVRGAGFISTSVVNWNGSPRTTTFVSSKQLTATINTTDIATAGTAIITITNPAPGGGASNVAFFQVTNPGSSLISLNRTDLTTNTGPVSVVAADFNKDGKLDLAVANSLANTVSILLGNGDGTFQPAFDVPVTGFPIQVVVGDFNGDGNLDFATVDQHSNQVSVVLGNGNGTFQGHVEFSTGTNPQAIALGDFNQDGKLDIVVVNFDDNTASILTGNGDGTFKAASPVSTGTNPQGVAVGDFNNDGKLDLAVANNGGNTVSVLLGNGNGTFQTHQDFATATVPNWVTAADLNNDGKQDLIATCASGVVSVLLGQGNGKFGKHTDFATGSFPFQAIVGDFNADGKVDLAVPNFNDNTVSILLGNGNGTFQARTDYPTGTNAVSLMAADFNNDGLMDLAVANEGSGNVSVMLQTAVSASPAELSFGSQEVGIAAASKTVTLTNNSSATFNISGISVTGADPSDYTQTTTCGTSLATAANCTITVTFKPTASGTRNAAVTVAETSGGSIGIFLTGTGIINITVSPASLTFPVQLIGTTSKPKTVTLTNLSATTVTINSITLTGTNPGDFAQTNTCGTSVGPSSKCTITVTFTPTSSGGRAANVLISGSFTAGTQNVQLSGTGTAVLVTPTKLTFASQTVGTTSSPQTVTFTNKGSSALAITSVTFSGKDPSDFAQTNTCGSSVAAAASCTFSVTFTPKATGTRTASMRIGDPDPTGPQSVSLTGTGK